MKTDEETLILIVDDKAAVRYVTERVIRGAGFRTAEAACGEEALVKAAALRPDLILLDINMPDLDGYEVCRRIRRDEAMASVGIVMISATFESAEHRVRGLEGGADTFLVAPIEPAVLVATVRAMLRLKRAEAELREADRRKDEFLATLAHELRNPLAPIRTGLELLRMLGDERNVVNDALRRMETQMGHLVRLVDDLLDLSRITSGKVTLRKTLLELGGVIRTTAEALRPELADAGHRLELVLPEQPLHVLADETRVAQIVSNLVNNASKYTPAGGRIGIRVTHEDGHAIVRVSDNGMGIPAAMLERIFEMFVQVERNVDRMQAGLGIGLTLVKRLVEMHGGTIAAASEGAGKGSTFEVRLPVAAPVAVARPAKKEPDARRRRLRVLVADDNEDAVLLLAAVIEMLGHDVCAATDGRQAVAYARDWRPDLVLMDLGMPRLNGIEAARRIRREPWGHDLPLVALTGWGQEDDKRATKAAGFDRHLTKPVDAEALSALLSGDQALVSP